MIDADPSLIQDIDKIIVEYEKNNRISFDIDNKDSKEEEYLNLSLDQISKMSIEAISNAIYIMNRYAIYVQRIINKHKAYERWAIAKIDEIASRNLDNIPNNIGWGERMLIAKNKPDLCQRLNRFLRIIRIKIDRLDRMPDMIHKIAESFRDIKYSKIAKVKNEQ